MRDGVDPTLLERRYRHRFVIEEDQLEPFRLGGVVTPVVRVLREGGRHALLEVLDLPDPGAGKVGLVAAFGIALPERHREDDPVVVVGADKEREAAVGLGEGELHRGVVKGDDVLWSNAESLEGRRRVAGGDVGESCHHIRGRHRGAIVIGHSLTQIERPDVQRVVGLPAFGQDRNQVQLGVGEGQVLTSLPEKRQSPLVVGENRIDCTRPV